MCCAGHKAFGRNAGFTCGRVLVDTIVGFWMAGFALSRLG